MTLRKLFTGIRAKLIILFILIGPLPVLVSGLFTVWQSEQGLIAVEQDRLHNIGMDNKAYIERWFGAHQSVLQQLANLPSAPQLDRTLFLPILELEESTRQYFGTLFTLAPDGEATFGVDFSRGDPRLLAAMDMPDYHAAAKPWFERALAGELVVSRPYLRLPFRGTVEKYMTDIGVPIVDEGRVVGVLAATVWLDPLFERIEQVALDQGADVFFIDADGVPITGVEAHGRGSARLTTAGVEAVLRGEDGVAMYDNVGGAPVMGAYAPLSAFDWGLVIEVDEERALRAAAGLGAHLRNALIYFGLGTVAVVIVVGVVASGTITRPVFAFARATRRVAAGDLTVPDLPVTRRDELGDIARDFTQMVNDLRQAIGDVREMTVKLNESGHQLGEFAEQSYRASDEITTTISQVASGTSSQTEAIHETAESVESWQQSVRRIAEGAQAQTERVLQTNTLIEGMAQTLKEVALAARQVASSAERDVAAAHAGGDAVRVTVDGMEQIRTSVTDAADRVRELEEHSQKIGEIVRIIEEIAEHTNLLALNAAIEAARAGEHGRGFAVVAQEVRTLAENSARSTQQITALIDSMLAGMDTAIAATTSGLEQVEEGSRLAVSAGEALDQIIQGIDESHEMAREIAHIAGNISDESVQVVENVNEVAGITREHTQLTEEMSAAAGQVVRAVTEISTVSEQTAASAQQVAASAAEGSGAAQRVREASVQLEQFAAALDTLIGRFKL